MDISAIKKVAVLSLFMLYLLCIAYVFFLLAYIFEPGVLLVDQNSHQEELYQMGDISTSLRYFALGVVVFGLAALLSTRGNEHKLKIISLYFGFFCFVILSVLLSTHFVILPF